MELSPTHGRLKDLLARLLPSGRKARLQWLACDRTLFYFINKEKIGPLGTVDENFRKIIIENEKGCPRDESFREDESDKLIGTLTERLSMYIFFSNL